MLELDTCLQSPGQKVTPVFEHILVLGPVEEVWGPLNEALPIIEAFSTYCALQLHDMSVAILEKVQS